MSSLAAARADNFYHPPDFDPAKHGSLNKYHGSHALRDRARKLGEGILIIRFEVPFNIWCGKCGEHIAKGVRFNAEKKQVGSYHSTKIWSFAMRHHCGCRIVIQTDPKNAEYIVTDGARRKVEAYSSEDAQTVELPDANERAAIAADPLASLERKTVQAEKAAAGRVQLVQLAQESQAKHGDEYSLNKQLRAALRQSKKADAQLVARRQALGLPEHVRLLPAAEADAQAAQLALFASSSDRFASKHEAARDSILTQSIFGSSAPAAAAAAAGPKRAGAAVAGPVRPPRQLGRPAMAGAAGKRSSRGPLGVQAASPKDALAARVLAAKRKKQQQETAGRAG